MSDHWICTEPNGTIVAAARLTLVWDFQELPYPDIFRKYNGWPADRPFYFYSRLVIHPEHRKKGLKEVLDRARIKTHQTSGVAFGTATASINRTRELARYGFKGVESVSVEDDPLFPFDNEILLLLLLHDIRL